MHNEDYIASGILELYAAGGLTQTEREEVEQRAAASPEIRLALDEACATMEAYAGLYAVQPRPELKEKILQPFAGSAPEGNAMYREDSREHPLFYTDNNKEDNAYKWLFAASIALFLLSGWLSFHFYNKWQQAEQKLASVITSEQALAQNFKTTSLQLQEQEKALSILRDPAYKLVRLKGVAAHPEAKMLVYWNPQQQQVYIDDATLPVPPAGKQYQLWALKDGKPIDAGMIKITNGNTSLQLMKNIGSAQAFAVTLEPTGGSKLPTLEQLTVMGNVES